MEMKILKEELLDKKNEDNELYKRLVGQLELEIYPNSVFDKNNLIFFIAKEASEKISICCSKRSMNQMHPDSKALI